jgi:hypothetical protein
MKARAPLIRKGGRELPPNPNSARKTYIDRLASQILRYIFTLVRPAIGRCRGSENAISIAIILRMPNSNNEHTDIP